MKSFAITSPGLEKYAADEISELIDVKTKTEDSVVLFDCTEEQLAFVCYRSQTIIKAFSFLEKINLDEISDLEKLKTDFSKVIPSGKTFRVKVAKQGGVQFSSQELEPALADVIFSHCKPTVSLTTPDVIVYLYVYDSSAYVGVDYCGFDVSKRDYRVFTHPRSVHANIAACLLRIAGFDGKMNVLDPFCLSGEVGIEASLYASHKSPHYFSKDKFAFNKLVAFNFDKVDKEIKEPKATIVISSPAMSDVRAAQKNAKIAGVEKYMQFTRQDVEWLDFKFDKNSVDCIVSFIPCPSAATPERLLKKMYEDFFFNIKEPLAKGGVVVVCGKNLDYFKKLAVNVKLKKEISFMNGKDDLFIAVFEKI